MRKIYFWYFTFCFVLQAWAGVSKPITPGVHNNILNKASITETSSGSDIVIVSPTMDIPSENIDYTAYNAPSNLTDTNSIAVGEFTIRDGGASGTDSDEVATTINFIQFKLTNSENIAAIAIFDEEGEPVQNLREITNPTEVVRFLGLTLSAEDNSTKNFTVRVTFKSGVTDNAQIELTVTRALKSSESSGFIDLAAGSAQTSTSGDDNRIEVTATEFLFEQEPTNGNALEILQPFPVIIAADDNGNKDLDFNETAIPINTVNPSSIVSESYDMTNGEAVLNNIVFSSAPPNSVRLTAISSFVGISQEFIINGPLFNLAQQNFDSQTGWTYSSDTDFRTGSTTPIGVWGGPEGYFGEIELINAVPLSNSLFSDTIFGENDLNDTDNPFATLSFADIDVTNITNLSIQFDWEVAGYADDDNDIQYRLVLDGTPQSTWVDIFDGNGTINDVQGRANILIADGSNTVGLQVRLRNNRDDGYAGFDNFRLVSEFSGRIYTAAIGWGDESNVPDASTASENALIASGTYNVENDAKLNNLFINSGANVFIDFGKSLEANNVFNTGNIELNSISNNYSSLIVNETIKNEVTYERHVNEYPGNNATTGGNDFITAPVTNANQTFEALQLANPGIIPSAIIEGVNTFLFGPFDNDANIYINYTTANNSTTIDTGVGYRTASTSPSGSNFTFVGDVETGTITVPISTGTSSIFNLIGNPYPSYIRLDEFLLANSGEFDAASPGVYAYIGNFTSGFTVLNQAFSDANPEALIAPGQGFLVSSKVGGGFISFNPDMRSIGTSDDFITGRDGNNDNLAHLNLQLTNGDQIISTAIYFNANASLGMDSGYDSALFDAVTPDFALYSHLVENNTGLDLAVQSVNFTALDNVTIPLGIHATQGEQITVSLGDHNIPQRNSVILEDNEYNTFTDLKLSDYTFTPTSTLTDTGRFYLHVSPETLSTPENILTGLEIYTTRDTKELIIKGRLDQNTALTMFDVQGRQVTVASLNSANAEHRISVSGISRGIYVVELTSPSQTRTQKIIID